MVIFFNSLSFTFALALSEVNNFHYCRCQLQLQQWIFPWKGWVHMTINTNLNALNSYLHHALSTFSPLMISNSKPCMWALQQVWLRWSYIAVRLMGKPVLSAAWPEILTAPGMDHCAHDTCPTANVATADRTSGMGTRCCSVWIRI